jgi:hypothetical protein
MLFKKILSITLAAAMSASMMSAAPTITNTSVAVAADSAEQAEMAKCMLCHKEVPKSEIHVASNGCSACYDCYPAASCCFPTLSAKVHGTITAIDNDSVTFDTAGKFFFNAPLELQHLTNKLGHEPKVGEELYLEYNYQNTPDNKNNHYIVSLKSISNEKPDKSFSDSCQMCGKIFDIYDLEETSFDHYLYYCHECADESFPEEGKEISVKDEVIWVTGKFFCLKDNGIFKLADGVSSDAFKEGNVVEATFTYKKNKTRKITNIKKAAVVGTADTETGYEIRKNDMNSIYDTIEYIDDDVIIVDDLGPVYLTGDYTEKDQEILSSLKKGDIADMLFNCFWHESNIFLTGIVKADYAVKRPVFTTAPDPSVTTTTTTVVTSHTEDYNTVITGNFDRIEGKKLYMNNGEDVYTLEKESDVSWFANVQKGDMVTISVVSTYMTFNYIRSVRALVDHSLYSGTHTVNPNANVTTTTTAYWKKYGLSVGSYPTKVEYNIGEELDLSGGMAYGTVYDSHGMHGDTFQQPFDSKYFKIDDSEFDNTKPGIYTIYITYGEGEGMAKDYYQVKVNASSSQPVTTTMITTTLTAPVTSVKEYDRTSFRGTFDSYADCGSYKELYLSGGIKYTLSSLRLEDGLSEEKVTEILKSLNKGDNIIVTANQSHMAVNYLYDIFSIDLYSVTTHYNPSPTTTANVSYPYGGTNNDVPDHSTTYTEPERWMYGTGVDHFEKIKTIPTKTIYDEGEKLDLSGLVINAYHSVSRWSNKGNGETLRTDYIWNVTNIYPKYIKIESLDGDTSVSADEFNTLKGGTYIVKIGTDGSFKCNVEGESSDRTVYDTQSVEFSFIVYINSADKSAKLIKINNAEVTDFTIGSENGFVISNVGAYTINSCFDSDIRKGDIVSGNIYVSPDTNTIIRSELEVEEYSGDKGDANGDGSLDMGDVVLIMQSLANPNKYGENGTDAQHITKRGIALGDMNGDGISTLDALSIQRILLGLDPTPAS